MPTAVSRDLEATSRAMARTVDSAAHALRREAFVTAAARLFQAKGYEATSIQDILDELGASRGAFYHYFGSKSDLLEAVVDQMASSALDSVDARTDARLSADRQLHALFEGITSWKLQHVDLLLAVLGLWMADQNAVVREHLRRALAERLTPRMVGIVRQGVAEGTYETPDPEGTADVLVALLYAFDLRATELFLARRADTVMYEDVVQTFEAWAGACDRILGAASGSFPRADDDTLRAWYA
jgi:AcrR family transcriptional regulator